MGFQFQSDRRGRAADRPRARHRQDAAGLADRSLPPARRRVRASRRAARASLRRQAARARGPCTHGHRRRLARASPNRSRPRTLARFTSGIGAVILNVLMTKMVTDLFAGRERLLAMSVLINSWPIGIGISLAVDRAARRARGLALGRRVVRALRDDRSCRRGDALPSTGRGGGLRFHPARGQPASASAC